jgi:hypothetical protein
MKVYIVCYYDCYDAFHLVGVFTTEDKAKKFIEYAKNPFFKDKVLYDYRSDDLYWDVWDMDDFDDIMIKK